MGRWRAELGAAEGALAATGTRDDDGGELGADGAAAGRAWGSGGGARQAPALETTAGDLGARDDGRVSRGWRRAELGRRRKRPQPPSHGSSRRWSRPLPSVLEPQLPAFERERVGRGKEGVERYLTGGPIIF
uniref:Uncharacterized protein n=1 Tax=Oryza rufipogon TaxID=4529 RepID=A0A679BD14_ORYRU|nr:hypothetical protein [Oryza rufipogon]BBF90028.1 hypothetical protein [Oryza rufipogon]